MFDPREFLDLAKTLVSQSSDEAHLRTAIGRAMYSVFLYARETLEAQGVQVKEASPEYLYREHNNVKNAFNPGYAPRPRYRHHGIHARILDLYNLRQRSDYSLDETVSVALAEQALDDADYCFAQFRQLF